MFRSRFARLAILVGALAALAGCSTSALQAPKTLNIESPTFEVATRDSAVLRSITATVVADSIVVDGATGGVLTVGSFRLEIPAGAIKGIATVSITQPDASVMVCDIHISPPTANAFAIPVTLAAKLPDSIGLTDQMMWFDPNAKAWQIIASSQDTLQVELHTHLWHFSKYGCSRAGW